MLPNQGRAPFSWTTACAGVGRGGLAWSNNNNDFTAGPN